MDSYEYYLLFHVDREGFKGKVTCDDGEMLAALEKLLKNGKIMCEDKIEIFHKLIDEKCSEVLTDIYELFGIDCIFNFLKNASDFNLRLTLIYLSMCDTNDDDFNYKLGSQLIDYVFYNKINLQPMTFKNISVERFVLEKIYERSSENLQNYCNFFEKMCQLDMIESSDLKIVENIFSTTCDNVRTKQGIYLLNVMIKFNIFDRKIENSLKVFINAIESLESNQSHLILPALDTIDDENFRKCISEQLWTFLIEKIINHSNKIVRAWGLKYFMKIDYNFTKNHILIFLTALNASGSSVDNFEKFVTRHYDDIMEIVVHVDWRISFYFILKCLKTITLGKSSFKIDFIEKLKAQVDSIPSKLKNLKIRSGVQFLYADIFNHIVNFFDIKALIPLLISIFKITKDSQKCIEKLALSIKDYEAIFSDQLPCNLVLIFLTKTQIGKDIKTIKKVMNKVKNGRKIIFKSINLMNKLTETYDEDINMLLQEAIDALWLSIFESNTFNLLESIEILEIAFEHNLQFDSENVVNFMEIFQKLKACKDTNFEFEIAYWKMLNICIKCNCDEAVLDSNFHKIVLENHRNIRSALLITSCQVSRFQVNGNMHDAILIIDNIEYVIDKVVESSEINQIFHLIEKICSKALDLLDQVEFTEKLLALLKTFFILSQNQSIESYFEATIYEK
jgi:hypothetical protein